MTERETLIYTDEEGNVRTLVEPPSEEDQELFDNEEEDHQGEITE